MKRHLIAAGLCALITPAIAIEPDVIIDAHTDAATAVELGGSGWVNETVVTNAFRGNSKLVVSSTSANFARFHTRLPSRGPYSVYVWHNGGMGFAYSTTAQVTHADTNPASLTLNQYSNAGQWVLLGTFWFEGNDNGLNDCKEAEVKLIASNSKFSADAVRFVLATPDVIVDSTSSTSGVTFAPNSSAWTSMTDPAGNNQSIRRSNTSGATVTLAPTLPAGGDYEVSVWLPRNAGAWLPGGGTAATTFDVDVFHRTGTTTVAVSLPATGINEGQWVQVVNPNPAADAPEGTFRFDATPAAPAANPNKIVIKTNGASGQYVPADAVRFSKVGVFSNYMDEDDPAGPPGTVASPNPGSWLNNTTLTPRPWAEWKYNAFGPAWKSYNFTSSNNAAQSMIYTPAVPELGFYDIYLWYPAQSGYASYNNLSTQLTVHSALGDVVRTVDQRSGTGGWTHAGRYILHAGDDADPTKRPKITIATPTNPYAPGSYYYNYWFSSNQGYVLADGVMFLREGEEKDLDADGLPDWLERLLGTDTYDENGNQINGNGGSFSAWDTDGDGMSDGDEYRLGRNPLRMATDGTNIMTLSLHTPTTR